MKCNAFISMAGLSVVLAGCSSTAPVAHDYRNDHSYEVRQTFKGFGNVDQHAQMSHKHREELSKSHCTQIDEANGKCDVANAPVGSKTFIKHFNGLTIVWKQNESVTVDGKLASVVESGGYGATWQQGIYKIITYKNNKIAVMQGDKFLGYAK